MGSQPLSHSFMCLSFVTAALLIGVQLKEGSSDSAIATLAPEVSTAPIILPEPSQNPESLDSQSSDKHQASNPALSETAVSGAARSHTGIAAALQTSLNPAIALQHLQLVVDLSDRRVYLYKDATLQANYEIAVGKEGWGTPTGQFKIINMQTDPIWQHPFTGEIFPAGAENPLGSRWIGFWSDGVHQIGFHGTNQDDLIGQAVSHGCIRMHDQDAQALYAQVVVGTPVVIRP